MKEYKLAAWPDLPASYRRTTYRRVLHEMSQRYVSKPQLMQASGLSKAEVQAFLQRLADRGALLQRGEPEAESSWFGTLQPMNWLRRTGPDGSTHLA